MESFTAIVKISNTKEDIKINESLIVNSNRDIIVVITRILGIDVHTVMDF